MKLKRFDSADIEKAVGKFEYYLKKDFWKTLRIQGKRFPKESDHPWAQGYHKYLKRIQGKPVAPETAQMAMEMMAILQFEGYWSDSRIMDKFINRLRNADESKGLIFECRIGYHFKEYMNCTVDLFSIPPDNTRICDLIISKGDEILEVECSRKKYKPERSMFNLANYLHKKAPQLSGNYPGIIAIHVPEFHDWKEIDRDRELLEEVMTEFAKPLFKSITMVVFSCDHPPLISDDDYFGKSYNMSIRNYKIRNLQSVQRPPDWFK